MDTPYPQEVPDSLAAADTTSAALNSADTTSAALGSVDTTFSALDSVDTFGSLGREVGETGRLIASGEFQTAADRAWNGLSEALVAFLPRLISAIFVLIVFYVAFRILQRLLKSVLERSRGVDADLAGLTLKTYRVVAGFVITLMVAAQFGIDVTALLAGLSIVGIAVGFAAKDTLENFIAGITILLDRPFRIGDHIQVDGTFGAVDEITLRSTRLHTLNNEVMIMPNSLLINQKLLNHTFLDRLRIEIPFGIAYKEHPAEARQAVLALLRDDDRLDPIMPPSVVVTQMNDSSVDMVLRFYILDSRLEVPVRFEYVEKVREALRQADIEIPFPHLQMFIDGAEGLKGTSLPAKP